MRVLHPRGDAFSTSAADFPLPRVANPSLCFCLSCDLILPDAIGNKVLCVVIKASHAISLNLSLPWQLHHSRKWFLFALFCAILKHAQQSSRGLHLSVVLSIKEVHQRGTSPQREAPFLHLEDTWAMPSWRNEWLTRMLRFPLMNSLKASVTCSFVFVFLKSRFTVPSSFLKEGERERETQRESWKLLVREKYLCF